MSSSSVSGAAGVPFNITGLASGLDTNSIISALLSAERQPLTRMGNQQSKIQGQQTQLKSIQSSLRQLAFSAAEFSLPSLFKTSQTVTSSEPTKVSAATSSGAGVGGHEVEVTQLANSAQRTFTFTSPASEDTITIDGHETKIAGGASAQELANAINSDSSATVYAAVLEGGTMVLSSRSTGNTGAGFVEVSDPGGTLSEKAGTAKEGKNAEYTVDGVAATSTSNTLTNAIAGVTLSLNGLTTVSGPVTINVAPPGPNLSAVEAQVQSFIKLYNSTITAIQTQLSTKPPTKPETASEFATGTLFGDNELLGFLNSMRQLMYEPVAGLPAEMSSLSDIGISSGAAAGGGVSSQSSIEGQLTLNSAALASAMQTNPAGVQQMLQGWSQNLQSVINIQAEPGGALESRSNGDAAQISNLANQIEALNEMLAVRQTALQATYAQLEGVIAKNQAQSSWLTSQEASLNASGI